ncbi:esterase-like activity of phytase family protein [Pectobacterium carotovorum]|uniref:esterase-like activity of phytase family protein n=1 Tax=Pectobacterium carotovorum TaxID=554 RepID=UPI00057C93AC|nr:esterase-like activity of phytase family protein [Pectobacterium carotovorum]KHT36272.1 esterase-like activity of phytase family protein [Pectobacterium carotovorum subsp. carotovorum]UFT95333.1 esterase-like activity of phytase family protein [Pectobacterium carotovorum]
MKHTLLALLVAGFLPFSAQAEGEKVTRYVVTFPASDHVAYQGKFAKNFPNGLPVGIGSGLYFTGKQGDDMMFTTVTDRGPNADAPLVGEKEAKIFASPDYAPLMMDIRVSAKAAEAINARPLHDAEGKITGLPLPADFIGTTNEVALNDALQPLSTSQRGLDTEGITPDGKGGFWLCDEYGPFLIHVDASGKILQKFGPTPAGNEHSVASGLPNIIKWRQPNRGFEGLTRLPDGTIVMAVQSTLDIDGKSKNKAQFTRLVMFNPETKTSRMVGYPINIDSYKKAKDAKIGDIVALDNQRILLVEQGADKDKQMQNRIYLVDLSKASDLTPFDADGKSPEFDDLAQLEKRGITLAHKQELVDLRKLGWQQEKVEGLALVDKQTLAVINDNDFGLQSVLQSPVKVKDKADDYQVTADGKLTRDGKAVETTLAIKPLEKPEADNELWVITLAQPLK